MPTNERVKFNVDGLLRSDLSTRYAAHAVGISSGFLTVDEARTIANQAGAGLVGSLPVEPAAQGVA